MTAQYLFAFREMAFFMIFLMVFFFKKKNRYKKLTELEFLNLIVGCCHVTVRG